MWTEAPPRLRPLRGQRIRWHIGLLDNVRIHRRMLGRRRYGAVGLLSLPYTVLVEVMGPLLQITGYVIVIVLAVFGEIAWEYAIALMVVVLLVAQLQTAGAILTEEIGFGRYRRRDLLLIGGWSLLEMFWYQPLSAVWRVLGEFPLADRPPARLGDNPLAARRSSRRLRRSRRNWRRHRCLASASRMDHNLRPEGDAAYQPAQVGLARMQAATRRRSADPAAAVDGEPVPDQSSPAASASGGPKRPGCSSRTRLGSGRSACR